MAKLVAIDIGNDSVKAIIQENSLSTPRKYHIPNVVAKADEIRGVIALENRIEEGIHCKITSGALSNNGGIYTIGNLATRSPNNSEPEPGQEKGLSDQAVIMLLATLALDAAQYSESSDEDVIEVKCALSTGLPLREARRPEAKEQFRNKLRSKIHEIEFLQTPVIVGKKVRIEFDTIDVYSEGQAAMMHLVTDEYGKIKNEELLQKSILINDIGGLSTDSAVIEHGIPDNMNSDGIRKGVSEYLDTIIEEVYEKFDHRIRSRRNLVRDVLLASGEKRNHIMVDGKLTSIQDIVDNVLFECAEDQHEHLDRMWKKVSDIELCYQIGGGSALIKDYLTKVNQESKHTYPLRFSEPEESIWMIVQSYWTMLVLSQKATVTEGV